MKLCFFTIWREDSETVGINMKIRNQVAAFSKLGVDSYLCISASMCVKLYHYNNIDQCFELAAKKEFNRISKHSTKHNKVLRKVSSLFRLKECLCFVDEMTEKYNFDIIYIRRIIPFTNNIYRYIKKWACAGKKLFWEIPTWGENVHSLSRILIKKQEERKYHKLEKVMRVVAISSGQDAPESILTINNGVSVESIRVKNGNCHDGINLICLATFSVWHGYDRLIEGLKQYYSAFDPNKVKVNLYMVGNGNTEALKKQVSDSGLEKHVYFTGVKSGDDLDLLFDDMDVAIGNLGFFRKGVTSDTSIKIREYCSRGIPFVTALKVNDFPEDYPYIFHAPMDDSPIDIDALISWYKAMNSNEASVNMRKYAEENLTWEKQLSKVIAEVK